MSENLDLEQIRQYMNRDCELFLFEKTDSTNDQAMLKVKQGRVLPLACFAEEQTQGRGRRGKVWLSPPCSSVYLSLAWKFDLSVNDLGALSLAMGVAVARMLRQTGLEKVGLKWPNDVLLDDKKIAGILIETTQIKNRATTAIIGVGLNFELPVNSPEMPDQPWTDIISELPMGRKPGRNEIAGLLLQECMVVCEDFVQNQPALMFEYQKYDICLQQVVNVYLEDAPSIQGVVVGFEANGEIRIRINNKEQLFNSADISLRKTSNANN